jgi:hypothetical protein
MKGLKMVENETTGKFCDDPSLKGKTAEENKVTQDKGVTSEPKLERNNAQIIPMGGSLPVSDYECYNEELKIWRGNLIIPGTDGNKVIFFSRKYQPEINDLDQIFVEIEITDPELLGVPFILVPKEKLMFGYERATTAGIIRPKLVTPARPRMQ